MDHKIESIKILDVRVDKVNMGQALKLTEEMLKDKGKHYIVTPNLEFILAAQKDEEFRRILNQADLAIPDSSHLGWLSRNKHFPVVTGTDLMEKLCELASKRGFRVGFLGGRNEVAERCAECLAKKYPGLKIGFAEDGPVVDENGLPKGQNGQTYKFAPVDILFVAFGQGKQEKWIAKNLDKLPVKAAMGVGGAFDYLSGSIPRAPFWLRRLGLEWLFRLIIQPWRIKRQLNILKLFYLICNR